MENNSTDNIDYSIIRLASIDAALSNHVDLGQKYEVERKEHIDFLTAQGATADNGNSFVNPEHAKLYRKSFEEF